MECSFCGATIPPERLEALPLTNCCIRCSSVEPYTEDTADLIAGAEDSDLRAIIDG